MIEKLEKKYHIHIRDDSFYDPFTNRHLTRYKIFTADGCNWENGLSYRGLLKECREHGRTFINIYEKTVGGAEYA